MKRIALLAAALALAPLTAAGAAPPDLRNLSGDEAAALAVYAVPGLIAAARQTCADRLSSTGFLAKRGDALAQRYAAQQSAAWPLAKAALLKMAGGKTADQLKMFANLPDDAVRPLVDALIAQEASARIAPASCTNVERLAEALSPLQPVQAGKILGVLFDIASAGNRLIARAEGSPGRP
jgi:hypothetical protein